MDDYVEYNKYNGMIDQQINLLQDTAVATMDD